MSETWSWLIKNISALLRALTLFSPFIFLDLISYSLLLLIGMWVAHIWTNMICIIFIFYFFNYRKKYIYYISILLLYADPKREKLNKKKSIIKEVSLFIMSFLCNRHIKNHLAASWAQAYKAHVRGVSPRCGIEQIRAAWAKADNIC